MRSGAPAVLVCAAAGTGLSTVLSRLEDGRRVIADVESLICTSYLGDSRLALESDELPTMETVARQPRTELHERWRRVVSEQIKTLNRRGQKPVVLGMHLSWYNSDSNEFFFPAESETLRRGKFEKVIVLIDDIYDMFVRLQGPGDLYSEQVLAKTAKQLKKLGYRGKLTAPEKRLQNLQLRLEATEHALDHLLGWRRAEMIEAENLALSLGAELTLLATKHSADALRCLVDKTDVPRTYLSHRITEVRGMNKSSSKLPENLGIWAPVTQEVNELHSTFAQSGQLLINPTAIDELRFGGASGRTEYSPYLAARWPVIQPAGALLWSPVEDPEHTSILVPEGFPPSDPIASSVARGLASRIFFEIAFRDHYIVEHTPNLLVYRPFFCETYKNPNDVDWSGGVKPEVKHWQRHMTSDSVLKRAAFVHTNVEIRSRLQWLNGGTRFSDFFVSVVRNHLRDKLKRVHIPGEEIELLFSGKLDERPESHLAMNPKSFLRSRAKSIDGWIRSYGLASLHEIFTMLERPHRSTDDPIGNFDVAILVRSEMKDRTAENLYEATHDLIRFFSAQVDGAELSKDFWREVEVAFSEVFGCTLDDASFAAIGITPLLLQSFREATVERTTKTRKSKVKST
jgi:hypothetical protein